MLSHLVPWLVFIMLLGLFFRWFERSNIYFPTKEMEYTPSQYRLKFEEVTFITKDRKTINAWYIPASDTVKSVGTLLFCHGNAGNISDRLAKLNMFHDLKLNTLIFDYRGYGKSKGKPSEKGTYRDAMAAYEYLLSRKDVDTTKIILYGESLGCAIAIELAKRKVNAAALICESPFTLIAAVGKEFYPLLPTKLIVSNKYDSLSKIGQVTIPKLFIHSRNDEIMGFYHSEKLLAASPEPKELVVIKGSHNEGFLDSEKIYKKGIADFLAKHL
jgi:uncharacterized protein